MNPPAPRRLLPALLAALLLLGALLFTALGVWQIERLQWKQALVARIGERVHAAPVAAPGPAQWAALTRDSAEYLRVQLTGRLEPQRQVLVRASTELGAGYWVLTPLLRPDGSRVLVNRGFVPPERRQSVPLGVDGEVEVVGLLRLSEPGGGLLQDNQPAQGRWYSRDVAAIAATLGLQAPVAPYFVDAQTLAGTRPQWPRAGLTVLQFANNHLGYALTWFALATGSLGGLAFLLRDVFRQRRRAAPSS